MAPTRSFPLLALTALIGLILSACSGDATDENSAGSDDKGPAILGNIPCLDYDGIEDGSKEHYVVPVATYERHLGLIVERGYTPMTFTDFVATADTPEQLPDKPFLLFSDSSSVSFYKNAAPAVEEHKLKATVALECGQLAQSWAMTKAQIDDLVSRGFDLAAHTRTHGDLTQMDDAQLEDEIVTCRKELQAKGWTIDHFVYPYGSHSAKVRAKVKAAGYLGARATGAQDVSGGGYASFAKGRRYAIGCALPVSSTTDEQIVSYLDNSWLELEDVYEIKADVGALGKIARSDFGADSYRHVFLADEGDIVTFSLLFLRAGTFDIRLRVKAGTEADPDSTVADYAYRLDGKHRKHRADGKPAPDPASKHVTWGDHVIEGVQVDTAGVHVLEVKCLKDWSCLLDRLQVTDSAQGPGE